jgi:hypothetical protein
MPKRLPFRALHIPEKVTGTTLDFILLPANSRGTLHLPGEFSIDNRPPQFHVVVSASNEAGVKTERKQMGDKSHYVVVVDVNNHNDSPASAWLESVEE